MTLILQQLTISTTGRPPLIRHFDLDIPAGTIATVMGPSGCGKSTLLAAINGSLSHDFLLQGQILLNGENIHDRPMEHRHIGTLFQDDLLFPHMDVFENMAFGIPPGTHRRERQLQIETALQEAGLAGFERRRIDTLSGGQRARISLLRTLLSQPKAILLDEPFNKLDQQLRSQFRQFVFDQIRERQIPALLVTHDSQDRPESGQLIQLENNHA
ncbi:ATP-binding cassette domain-containing protein [Gynuella sp.]|uniref:ATP-binding cassette domain-containing protein n=1 Tax=Gynuella sp. TaxID=2969146 RepID=UPI003D0F0D8F